MQRAIDVKEHKRRDSPTRKSISRYGRHKFEISPSFYSVKTLYTVRIRSMLSKIVPEVEHLEHCFLSIVHSFRNIAGISITIPSIPILALI